MSNINPTTIEENFPIAGQDNDTKTFRDNFSSIVSNFEIAQTEITGLENTTARLTTDNNFENNEIENAVLRDCFERKTTNTVPREGAASSNIQIDYKSGSYHVLTIQNFVNVNISFDNLPGDSSTPNPPTNAVARMILEIRSAENLARTVTFTGSGGVVFKKSADFPTSFVVSSADDPIFIEVWRHGTANIFLRYLGQYS